MSKSRVQSNSAKNSSKKTISIFTSIEGHRSIAEAIKEALEPTFAVDLYIERDPIFDFYLPVYRFFPKAYLIPYQLSQHNKVMDFLRQTYEKRNTPKIQTFFDGGKALPDLLIGTYCLYNGSLEKVSAKKKIPFVNIITDPRTFHPLVVAKEPAKNIAFDAAACAFFTQLTGLKTALPFGWFVQQKFEEEYDQAEAKKALGLNPKVLTFLIASGSEGTAIVSKIFPFLFFSKKPLQLLISCGSNRTLFKGVQKTAQALKKIGSPVTIVPIGHTKELHVYMRAADLIIGKAGPNTLFESVATLTPFFAITHITGQENGNLDIIRDYKLGYVEEDPLRAAKLLKKIIDNPKELQKFQNPLKKMAEYNKQAKVLLKKLAVELTS